MKRKMYPSADDRRTPKVLVCITPQSNSCRLIRRGADITAQLGGELHILHVEHGSNLFATSDSSALIQDLFNFGSELGGIVHARCGEDIPETIRNFILSERITHVLLGEPPQHTEVASSGVLERLSLMLPFVKFEILTRES